MIRKTHFDLHEPMKIMLISNTPAFLARRLRGTEAVSKLFRNHNSDELRKAFSTAIKTKPSSSEARVWPFVIATALALQGQPPSAEQVRDANPQYSWLPSFLKHLRAQSSSNTNSVFQVRPKTIVLEMKRA